MPRLWETQMTAEERSYELAYRRAVLAIPPSAPRSDHPYPEFFTTSTYYVPRAFTKHQQEVLTSAFSQFEGNLRENKPKVWLVNFFKEWAGRFPEEPSSARERKKSILKFYINMLATRWSGDGRPEGKDGRMDVMTVRLDILHEMVDDFEYVFPESDP